MSAEARAGLTNEDEAEVSGFGGSGIDVSIDYYAGLYARATIPTQAFIRPYAIAGFTYGEVTAEAPGISESDGESDFSFGAGVELGNPSGLHFAGEYMRYFDKDGVEISALNVWLVSAF